MTISRCITSFAGAVDPLLLIHGLGSSGADWAMRVAALEGRFRLVVPDLPGCGYSGLLSTECSIAGFAGSLWALLDDLQVERPNIIGFSLGGAVAIETALQRPNSVLRLALINSLVSYLIDHWRKWLEARGSSALISIFGMQFAGRIFAARLFPHPWQLADTQLLASCLRANLVMIRGSRHGTPFDSVRATNASLLALLTDQPPSAARLACDEPTHMRPLAFDGSLAEEQAMGA